MSMRDEITADIVAALATELPDVTRDFTAVREGEYNPIEDTTGLPVLIDFKGIAVGYSASLVDGINILSSDQKLICLQDDVPEPIKIGDMVDDYRVLNVSKDPLNVSVTLHLRLN